MIKTSPKVQELRRKIYIKAKAENSHRFWGLYVHLCKTEILYSAYHLAKANRGAAGIDKVTFEDIEREGLHQFIRDIQQDLQAETYLPERSRIVEIPKANGKTRKLSVPTIRDRVVQNALRQLLEPVFEADFQDGSYGYRPKRTVAEARKRVEIALARRCTRVIDLDLKSYFDTVRHHILLSKVGKRIADDKVMHLLKLILKAGGKKGVPQGGPLSPLLSNIYLNELDMMLEKAKRVSKAKGYLSMEYTRFADDLTVQVNQHWNNDWLWHGLNRRIREELTKLQVEINEEKTRYVNMEHKQRFNFLGFTFLYNKRKGKIPCPICIPRKEAKAKVVSAIKRVFASHRSQPLEDVVAKINPILRGWLNYYRIANSGQTFNGLRHYVMGKVRKHLMRAKHKWGYGWKRWSTQELIHRYKIYDGYHVQSWKAGLIPGI